MRIEDWHRRLNGQQKAIWAYSVAWDLLDVHSCYASDKLFSEVADTAWGIADVTARDRSVADYTLGDMSVTILEVIAPCPTGMVDILAQFDAAYLSLR